MIKLFRNSFFIILLASIFIISGCACKKDFKKSNMLKGAMIGIIPGAVVGGETSDDDDSDEIAVGMIGGAIVGGLIGALFDTCEPEPVQVAQAPVDTDSDGDGVVDGGLPGTGCLSTQLQEHAGPAALVDLVRRRDWGGDGNDVADSRSPDWIAALVRGCDDWTDRGRPAARSFRYQNHHQFVEYQY